MLIEWCQRDNSFFISVYHPERRAYNRRELQGDPMETSINVHGRVGVPVNQWQVIVEVISAICALQAPGDKAIEEMIQQGALEENLFRLFNNQLHYRLIHEKRGVSLLFGPVLCPHERPIKKIWPPEGNDDLLD